MTSIDASEIVEKDHIFFYSYRELFAKRKSITMHWHLIKSRVFRSREQKSDWPTLSLQIWNFESQNSSMNFTSQLILKNYFMFTLVINDDNVTAVETKQNKQLKNPGFDVHFYTVSTTSK